MCIKELIWPPFEPKTENCFSQIYFVWFIRIMTEVQNLWHLFKSYCCFGNKNGRQNRHKIEKLPFLTKFKAFRDKIFKN